MTDEQLPAVEPEATGTVSFAFAQTTPMIWAGTATCPHGTTRNATYLIAVGVPPLNHTQMVDSVYRQHDQLIACDCTRARPKLAATVTFQVPVAGVPAGQQRYVPQLSASLVGSNLWWGPGLTIARSGGYNVQAKVQLALGPPSATGLGVVLISGQPVLGVPMVDEGGKATANINANLNLANNQSIAIGYENTSNAVQDVALCTLTVSDIWVP